MLRIAVISLFVIVPALAQPVLKSPLLGAGSRSRLTVANAFAPSYAKSYAQKATAPETASSDPWTVAVFDVNRGAASPSYAAPVPAAAGGFSPEQLAFMERQRSARGEPSSGNAAPAAAASAGAGGFSPEQLAFMERQNSARGGASGLSASSSYDDTMLARRAAEASYSGGSSYSWDASSARDGKSGFSPRYAPAYAPNYFDEPQELDELTQPSSNAVSLFAAALIGALVGVSGVTFVTRFRRSASISLGEPFVAVSN